MENVKEINEHPIEKNKDQNKDFPGYPHYPKSEDIFKKEKEIKALDPDTLLGNKSQNDLPDTKNEKDFGDLKTGKDLDVPGADLDDQMEDIGSEDEENNYYSIGGENHDDLEEDNG